MVVAEFDRGAATAADAIASAVRDLDSIGVTASRVLVQDLVTLADIADRIGRSREAVRRYAIGSRGPGGFPAPVVANLVLQTRMYRHEVPHMSALTDLLAA